MERDLERAAELEKSDLLKQEWRSLRAARGAAMRAQGSRTVSAGVHVWHDGSRVHCAFASVSEAPEFCCFVCDRLLACSPSLARAYGIGSGCDRHPVSAPLLVFSSE